MNTKSFRALVDELLGVIGRIVDLKGFPFLPVIYSSLFYFVEKGAAYRRAVLAAPALPQARRVTNKPDPFVDGFLEEHAPFALEFDRRARRACFARLYPVLALRDPFLRTLFRDELDRGNLEAILDRFDGRVATAVASIPPARHRPDFWAALDAFVESAAGLGIELVREREIQDLILERVKKFLGIKKKK